jgi:N-acetylmuramoyl-L-alanine amidase
MGGRSQRPEPGWATSSAADQRRAQALRRGRVRLALIIVGIIGVVLGLQQLTAPGSGSASDKPHDSDPDPVSRTGHFGTALDPAVFAPGSCEALAPTVGNRHETVFLDAGHGGADPGAVGETESGATIYEKDITLPVELDTAALLREDGYRVVVSRTTSGPVARPLPGDLSGGIYTDKGAHYEVAERDVCANLAKADVLIGIYFDAGASPADGGSLTAYDPDRPFASENLKLANLLQKTVLADMNAKGWQIPDGGVNSSVYEGGPALTQAAAQYDHLMLLGPAKAGYFSTPSEMPGAVIEPLFITDPFEGSIAASTEGQRVIAGGIADTVEKFLGSSRS